MAAFVLSAFVLAMLPGPATVLLIREVASGNRQRVVGVIGGIEVGIFAWAVLSGLGVAALVAVSALAYTGLRVAGAAVLILLGLQTLWYAWRRRPEPPKPLLRLTGFRGGLLTNLANPKAAVFAFSFYPQFIPHGSNALAYSVLLGTVHVLIDVCWYTVLAGTLAKTRDLWARSAVKRWMERIVGAVLVALGLRLAID
ncbi:LysE family translocator [Planosporangium sp. 12N6]|uniref:LysE family translocator n=1 Tax=Planosporangium spinosum TaxID=3402278 RepID=UPI003CF17A43